MIDTIIKAAILGLVLYVVFILIGMLITAISLPAVILPITGILLALCYLAWLLKALGITF